MEPYHKNTKNLFFQYKQSRNWVSSYDESPTWGLWGGSGLVATAEDLAIFCQALASNKIFENPETLNLMFLQLGFEEPVTGIGMNPTDEEYASQYRMGITKIDGPGFKAFGHDGYWGSLMYHLPGENASFAFYGLNADETLDFDKLFVEIIRALSQ